MVEVDSSALNQKFQVWLGRPDFSKDGLPAFLEEIHKVIGRATVPPWLLCKWARECDFLTVQEVAARVGLAPSSVWRNEQAPKSTEQPVPGARLVAVLEATGFEGLADYAWRSVNDWSTRPRRTGTVAASRALQRLREAKRAQQAEPKA